MPAGEARRLTLFPNWVNSFSKPVRGVRLNRQHQLAQGLRVDWLMNELAGVRIFDSVFPSAPPNFKQTGLFGAGAAAPRWEAGGGIQFDGGDSISGNPAFNPTQGGSIFPLTVACDCKLASTATDPTVWEITGTNNIELLSLAGLWDYGGAGMDTGSRAVVLNRRTQVTCRSLGASAHAIFLDGALDVTGTNTSTASGLTNLTAGTSAVATPMTGTMYWLRLWNRALFDDEASWLYQEPYDMYEPVFSQRFFFLQAPAGGTVFEVNLAGTLSAADIAGALSKLDVKPLAGALSAPSLGGVLTRQPTKVLAGAGTPAGAVTKLVSKPLTGTIGTIAGAVTTIILRVVSFTGAVGTIVGDLVRVTSKPLAGSSSSAGALLKVTSKPLTGTVGTITGSLITVKAVVRSMAGAVATITGALVRVPSKALAGILTPAGARSQQVTKVLGGAGTPTGALLKVTTKAGLAGTVGTITGTVVTVKAVVRSMSGAVATLTGALSQRTTKALAGAATPAGSLLRQTSKTLVGTQASSGVLTRMLTRVLTVSGAVASAGVLRREPTKALAGASLPAGTLRRQATRVLNGAITSIVGLLQVFVPSQISPRNRPVALFGADDRVMRLAGCDERVFALAGADDRVARLVGGGEHLSRLAGGLEQLARLFGIRQEDD